MRQNIILIIVALAMFMEAVDTTIINTAIPTMAHSLNVHPIDLKIALISYLITVAIFIPISGWIADKFGVKKVFISAIFIFTISSLWCGFTHNLTELIIARIVQGFGGALNMPVGRLIIVRTCKRHELISKMSIVVMVAALGMMLGPTLGGIITEYLTWPWIFWVNIPVGLITIILSFYLLPDMPARPIHKLDIFGFILFGSGLAFLTFGLSQLSETDVKLSTPLTIIGTAVFLIFCYGAHSRKKKFPIVKIELLSSRTFRVAVLGNLLARIGFGGIPFLVPLLLQIALLVSPQTSGILLAPTALGVVLTKSLSLNLLRFFGYKKLLILNTIIVGFSIWAFSMITSHTSFITIGFLTFLFGCLISLQYTGMNSLAYAQISETDLSAATSIMSTVQQLSQSFGVAIAAIIIRFFTSLDNSALSLKTFHETFFALGILTFFSIIIFLQLKAEDGKELIENSSL